MASTPSASTAINKPFDDVGGGPGIAAFDLAPVGRGIARSRRLDARDAVAFLGERNQITARPRPQRETRGLGSHELNDRVHFPDPAIQPERNSLVQASFTLPTNA